MKTTQADTNTQHKHWRVLLPLLALVLMLGPITVQAHPGRTDASGGHTCKTDCASWGLSAGEYHKHNAGGYTNSQGQQFDKQGNNLGGSQPKPTPTPEASVPIQPPAAVKPATTVVPSPAPSPEPTQEPESTPTPTPTPSPTLPAQEVTSEGGEDQDDGWGSDDTATLATLLTIVGAGTGGYYLIRRRARRT